MGKQKNGVDPSAPKLLSELTIVPDSEGRQLGYQQLENGGNLISLGDHLDHGPYGMRIVAQMLEHFRTEAAEALIGNRDGNELRLRELLDTAHVKNLLEKNIPPHWDTDAQAESHEPINYLRKLIASEIIGFQSGTMSEKNSFLRSFLKIKNFYFNSGTEEGTLSDNLRLENFGFNAEDADKINESDAEMKELLRLDGATLSKFYTELPYCYQLLFTMFWMFDCTMGAANKFKFQREELAAILEMDAKNIPDVVVLFSLLEHTLSEEEFKIFWANFLGDGRANFDLFPELKEFHKECGKKIPLNWENYTYILPEKFRGNVPKLIKKSKNIIVRQNVIFTHGAPFKTLGKNFDGSTFKSSGDYHEDEYNTLVRLQGRLESQGQSEIFSIDGTEYVGEALRQKYDELRRNYIDAWSNALNEQMQVLNTEQSNKPSADDFGVAHAPFQQKMLPSSDSNLTNISSNPLDRTGYPVVDLPEQEENSLSAEQVFEGYTFVFGHQPTSTLNLPFRDNTGEIFGIACDTNTVKAKHLKTFPENKVQCFDNDQASFSSKMQITLSGESGETEILEIVQDATERDFLGCQLERDDQIFLVMGRINSGDKKGQLYLESRQMGKFASVKTQLCMSQTDFLLAAVNDQVQNLNRKERSYLPELVEDALLDDSSFDLDQDNVQALKTFLVENAVKKISDASDKLFGLLSNSSIKTRNDLFLFSGEALAREAKALCTPNYSELREDEKNQVVERLIRLTQDVQDRSVVIATITASLSFLVSALQYIYHLLEAIINYLAEHSVILAHDVYHGTQHTLSSLAKFAKRIYEGTTVVEIKSENEEKRSHCSVKFSLDKVKWDRQYFENPAVDLRAKSRFHERFHLGFKRKSTSENMGTKFSAAVVNTGVFSKKGLHALQRHSNIDAGINGNSYPS